MVGIKTADWNGYGVNGGHRSLTHKNDKKRPRYEDTTS